MCQNQLKKKLCHEFLTNATLSKREWCGNAVGYVLTYVLPGCVSVVIFQSACLEGYKESCYKNLKILVIKAWISCAVASKVRRFRFLPMPRKWKWVDLQIPLIWSWKVRYWFKTTPRSLTVEDGETCISPTLTDKSLKFCFKSGDRKIINSVLESFILNLFLIIHTRISEIHIFNCVNDSKGSLHLNEM